VFAAASASQISFQHKLAELFQLVDLPVFVFGQIFDGVQQIKVFGHAWLVMRVAGISAVFQDLLGGGLDYFICQLFLVEMG
jgi:hypothetical protein